MIATCFIFAADLLRVFYGALIIYRGFHVRLPNLQFITTMQSALVAIGRFIGLPVFFPYLFYPFLYILGFLSNFHVDLSGLLRGL